jgi:acyl carrier protein
LNRNELIARIEQCVRDQSPAPPENLGEHTILYGAGGLLDSLGLVTLTLELESQVNRTVGSEIVISDDRALLLDESPFRTIGSLADYVIALVADASPS